MREPDLDLRNLLKLIRPYLLISSLLALLVGVTVYFFLHQQPPVFQTSAQVLAAQGALSQGSVVGTIPIASVLDAAAYREAALSNLVLSNTLKSLSFPSDTQSLERFRRNLRLQTVDGTQSNVLVLSVLANHPEQATQKANAWAKQLQQWDRDRVRNSYKQYRESLEAQLKTSSSAGNMDKALKSDLLRDINLMQALENSANGQLSLLDPAIVPARPIGPKALVNAVAATVLALLLFLAIALIRKLNDPRIRNSDEAFRITGLPVLGEFPETPNIYSRNLSPEVADYLEINLSHTVASAQKARVIAITSPSPSEGKSSVALSLARASARAGRRTLLMDLNLRNPMLYQEFATYRGIDSIDNLKDESATPPTTHNSEDNLDFIPCFQSVENPPQFLAKYFRAFIRKIQNIGDYDLIVLDTPAVLSVTDTLVIAGHVSGILMVVREGETNKQKLRSALAILKRVGGQVLGLVTNHAHSTDAFMLLEDERKPSTPSSKATSEVRPNLEARPTIEIVPWSK